MDAFHRERRIPVRRGRNRYEVKQVYIRFCFPDTATADAPQSLRWRVLDLRTGEAQAADSVTRRMRSGDTGGRGRLAQREMATTQGKSPFVSGMVVLATLLIAAPAAHAACKSTKNICKHFDDCLQQTSDPNNKDADGIRA